MNLSIVSISEFTYRPTNSKKILYLLEFGIIRNQKYPKILVILRLIWSLDLSSDHSPVIIILNSKLMTRGRTCTLHNAKTILLPRITEYF